MTELAKALGASLKKKSELIGLVERHLLAGPEVTERRTDCIHPSEAAHEDWCPRATYYRISGETPEPAIRKLHMELVFETGNDAHHKWQRWYREIGVLGGLWECMKCGTTWNTENSKNLKCPYIKCRATGDFIIYKEVPVSDDFYLLGGQSDGLVKGEPIEVKTIGVGTVRHEAPKLLERYSHEFEDASGVMKTGIDWQGLWAGIRRPFASHLRQGMLYMFCGGWPSITYIYDPKFVTSYPREYKIKFQEGIIDDILEQCLIVKSCLEKERPPKRPLWAEEKCAKCAQCPFKKKCYDRRPHREDLGTAGRSQERTRQKRAPVATPARVRFAETPYESD